MPLSFASNVFVQPRTMPGWLQAFVNVNPVTHLATAARDLMNNTGGAGGPVAWSLIATAAITWCSRRSPSTSTASKADAHRQTSEAVPPSPRCRAAPARPAMTGCPAAGQRHAATRQKKDHHRKDISHDGAHVRRAGR